MELTTVLENTQPTKNYTYKEKPFYDFVKRCFDIFCSLILIIVASPVLLLVAILVKVTDGGTIIYKAPRMGKGGKIIKVYKFRSMCMNADDIKKTLSKEDLEKYEKEYKLEKDPRITKIGNIIRKTSLDELPQLFNVLFGTMSLVGPRPVLYEETLLYGENRDLLLKVKPGITGLWQVSGRNNISYANGERQAIELEYVEKRSFFFDIKILILTVGAVFKMKGAM
ncbi:MAG: sugar transferase [Clostridia bacterium]|nr:sugar transferase [Clostridia bacterium]